jgi:hypothetical protein
MVEIVPELWVVGVRREGGRLEYYVYETLQEAKRAIVAFTKMYDKARYSCWDLYSNRIFDTGKIV